MNVRRKKIRQIVDELLQKSNVTKPPVDVFKIAKARGFTVLRQYHDDQFSGFIAQRDHETIIGVNERHTDVRKRFTVAHELGHALLHTSVQATPHVDRQAFAVLFRDTRSSEGTDPIEREANFFAAELLMPAEMLEAQVAKLRLFDLADDTDKVLSQLAKTFDVSTQAMAYRLSYLNLLTT